eukprot:scaffold20987_cov31-Tisochrysis_lutea.AAC.2
MRRRLQWPVTHVRLIELALNVGMPVLVEPRAHAPAVGSGVDGDKGRMQLVLRLTLARALGGALLIWACKRKGGGIAGVQAKALEAAHNEGLVVR